MPRSLTVLLPSLLILLCIATSTAQLSLPPCDGCARHDEPIEGWLLPQVADWGYGYADLLRDLGQWRSSPYVKVDSIGSSELGRGLWELTIAVPAQQANPRTVFVHVRTH